MTANQLIIAALVCALALGPKSIWERVFYTWYEAVCGSDRHAMVSQNEMCLLSDVSPDPSCFLVLVMFAVVVPGQHPTDFLSPVMSFFVVGGETELSFLNLVVFTVNDNYPQSSVYSKQTETWH